MSNYRRCWCNISIPAIRHNLTEAKKRVDGNVKMLAVVKANAYGHGAVTVARGVRDLVDFFAVATVEEAVELRDAGLTEPILILAYASPKQYDILIEKGITPTIYNLEEACKWSEAAKALGKKAPLHVALDTGMTRIGFQITEKTADEIAQIAALPGAYLEGMFTHLSCADQADQSFTMTQLAKYEQMVQWLEERGVQIPIRHVCNSAGIMELDTHRFEMVRSGIITYGMYPSEEVQKDRLDLIPALEWKSHVIHVKDVEPGRGVSYGATFVTEKEVTRIATISAGYADGYPRALSNKGRVLIRGQYAPILGRVCMDQFMVDVTHIPEVQVEDEVTLIGRDGENCITIEEVADPGGRFNYEMACTICGRVQRVYPDQERV